MPSLQACRLAQRFQQAVIFPRITYLPPEVRDTPPETPAGTDLAIWSWEGQGKFYGIAFQGKANKPLWHFQFRSEAERNRKIQETVDSRKRSLKNKDDATQARREYQHPYKVGDILYTSWGYDETHVNFYQVVDLKGKLVYVRPIRSKQVGPEEQGVSYVAAAKNSFSGPAIKVLPTPKITKIEGHSASIWDGKPKYETLFGWGH